MKKFLSIMLALCMMLSVCAVGVSAQEGVPMAQMQTKDIITIMVDGVYVDCAKYGQLPVIVEGRTLVPLRSVFEALGATVEWNNDTRSVTSVKGDVTVTLAVNSNEMTVNGTVKLLDVPAQIMNERTMVPVRAVAEAFGCKVEWDNNTRTVIILTEPSEPVAPETPEDVVKKVMDALIAFDIKTVQLYMADEDLAEEFADFDTEGHDSEIFKAIFGTMTYTVDNCVVEGDKAQVTVTLTSPDFESINLDEYVDDAEMEAVALEALLSNGYTLEDLQTADEAELEIMADIVLKATIDYTVNGLLEATKSADKISETSVIELVFADGRWLVTGEAETEAE